MRPRSGVWGIVLLITAQTLAHAQDDRLREARAALAACIAAVSDGRGDEAQGAARRAAELFRLAEQEQPGAVEPLLGHARVLSQCEVPIAATLRKEGLVNRSNGLLERALALDSTHWEARYILALNYYHLPAFMGRTRHAIREFETLLSHHAGAALFPEQAVPYAYLGDLYCRVGRPDDARRIWTEGARLFPDDQRFARRLQPDTAQGRGRQC